MDDGRDPELEDLMRDGAWLRRFVRTLVAEQDADDVLQTTWLAALQGSVGARRLRHWVTGAAANVARLLHRQRARGERALAAMPERGPASSPIDLVAGLEAQRAVSEAMLALPEPTRTILVLRYQEGLSMVAIAAQVGLQVVAVRQRLHRGRESVRARLQERLGADWRVSMAVFAFAGRAGVHAPQCASWLPWSLGAIAAALLTVVTMSATNKDGAALVPASSAAMLASTNVPIVVEPVATQSLADARVLVRTAMAAQEPAATTAIEIRGRLVAAEDRTPIVGASVTPAFRYRSDTAESARAKTEVATTDADGRFLVSCPHDAIAVDVSVSAAGRCPRLYFADPPKTFDLGDIPMIGGVVLQGRVTDETGSAMPDVWLEATFDGSIPDGNIGFSCRSTADGTFRWAERLPAGTIELQCKTAGVQLLDGHVTIVADKNPNEVSLRARRLPSIAGVVFDPDHKPLGGVELEAFELDAPERADSVGSCRSAADGSFQLFREHGDSEQASLRTRWLPQCNVLVGEAIGTAWGSSGLRLCAQRLVPIPLRVVTGDTHVAVERFALVTHLMQGQRSVISGDSTFNIREQGIETFPGLRPGTRIIVYAEDANLAPAVVLVDESMRDAGMLEVTLLRLQEFPLHLVDARDRPVTADCDVLDTCGATPGAPAAFVTDLRRHRLASGLAALGVSNTITDVNGNATLLAPFSTRELVLSLQRGARTIWIPLHLAAPGQPLRIVVPD